MDSLFCKNCGKILNLKTENENTLGYCECGYQTIISYLSFSRNEVREEKGEGVYEDIKPLALKHKCKKCGHEESDVVDYGVQVGDESNIIVYFCRKCKYAERESYGTGNS